MHHVTFEGRSFPDKVNTRPLEWIRMRGPRVETKAAVAAGGVPAPEGQVVAAAGA